MNILSGCKSIAAFACLAIPFNAFAVEALETAELASHCDKYHQGANTIDGEFCVRYIQGFIDGAVATDERVTMSVSDEYEKEESFSERAARTRIGIRLQQYGPSVYAGYCLGDPLPLATVVEKVVADLADTSKTDMHPLARDLVYQTLVANYPCDEA